VAQWTAPLFLLKNAHQSGGDETKPTVQVRPVSVTEHFWWIRLPIGWKSGGHPLVRPYVPPVSSTDTWLLCACKNNLCYEVAASRESGFNIPLKSVRCFRTTIFTMTPAVSGFICVVYTRFTMYSDAVLLELFHVPVLLSRHNYLFGDELSSFLLLACWACPSVLNWLCGLFFFLLSFFPYGVQSCHFPFL
jgi:hypothetical protein